MPENLNITPKILVVSNQQGTGPLWVYSLQQKKLDVVLECSAANTIQRWAETIPDLVIFDVNISEEVLLQLIRDLRAETSIPLLLITHPKGEPFFVEAYQAGIDETIIKPIGPTLLHAKIQVWLQRSWIVPADTLESITAGNLQLQPTERLCVVGDNPPVRLTNLELRLLYILMTRPNRTVSAEELIERVWGYSNVGDNTMLKNVIYRMRRKIEVDPASPRVVQTVVGVGYKFVAE